MTRMKEWILLALLSAVSGTSIAQVYPSAKTAWVIPGNYSAPTSPDYLSQFPDSESVRQWELQHADLILGGDPGSLPANNNQPSPYVYGYMYNQKLEFNPGWLEMNLRQRAERAGDDYESLFLHFAEDTWLRVADPDDGALTPFGGFPYAVGWTVQPNHAGFLIYQTPPYDKPVWEHHQQGGGLYVYLFEPFDRLKLELSATASNGELVVEYPSLMDNYGQVLEWQSLEVTDDTDNLSRSGEIRWTPPSDWQRAKTHDGSGRSYGGGPYLGKTLIRDGGRFYVVRLMWRNGDGSVPRLADIRLKDWMPYVSGMAGQLEAGNTAGSDKGLGSSGASESDTQTSSQTAEAIRLVRGWDPDNDVNGDGYIDDEEFAGLINPYAQARFQYEARAVPLGSMWSSRSSWCRPNLFHPRLGQYLGEGYKQSWQSAGLSGAYNDDLYKLLATEFDVVSGGRLQEYDGVVNQAATENAYRQAFARVLTEIATKTERFLGANISMLNAYGETSDIGDYLPAFSLFLREGYIRPSLGLSGWFGLNRAWDTFALAAADRWSILMAMVNHGSRVFRQGNEQLNWEMDIESALAQFYLLNVPGKTFFHIWNHRFNYGSGNTSASNYYQAGIPKNLAYQPGGLLSVDIGEPDPDFPAGQEALAYMARNSNSDYNIVGYSNAGQLTDIRTQTYGQNIPVQPSNIFYLQRSGDEVVFGGPEEMILARKYTKGLILYRTDFFGHSADFQQSVSEQVLLPGLFRRVRYDGSLSEPLSSIVLRGYEGAILKKID